VLCTRFFCVTWVPISMCSVEDGLVGLILGALSVFVFVNVYGARAEMVQIPSGLQRKEPRAEHEVLQRAWFEFEPIIGLRACEPAIP
jgi:hypothetical protein